MYFFKALQKTNHLNPLWRKNSFFLCAFKSVFTRVKKHSDESVSLLHIQCHSHCQNDLHDQSLYCCLLSALIGVELRSTEGKVCSASKQQQLIVICQAVKKTPRIYPHELHCNDRLSVGNTAQFWFTENLPAFHLHQRSDSKTACKDFVSTLTAKRYCSLFINYMSSEILKESIVTNVA